MNRLLTAFAGRDGAPNVPRDFSLSIDTPVRCDNASFSGDPNVICDIVTHPIVRCTNHHRYTPRRPSFCGSLVLALACAGCASTSTFSGPAYQPLIVSKPHHIASSGSHLTLASWYGPGFDGHRTSNGDIFDRDEFTAASRTLPLGSFARVTNLDNGKSVVVRVNDHGPYVRGRGIDLSEGAAARVGLMRKGVARVRVARIDTAASENPDPGELWSGRVTVRRHYYPSHYHRNFHRSHSTRTIFNPIGTWLLELIR